MSKAQDDFRLTAEPIPCTVPKRKRTARTHAPNLSLEHWQRLLDACPIKRTGEMMNGDFLACGHVSQTPLSVARIMGGCTFGNRVFIYLPQHDLLVRKDFHRWAMRNWRNVLCGSGAQDATK